VIVTFEMSAIFRNIKVTTSSDTSLHSGAQLRERHTQSVLVIKGVTARSVQSQRLHRHPHVFHLCNRTPTVPARIHAPSSSACLSARHLSLSPISNTHPPSHACMRARVQANGIPAGDCTTYNTTDTKNPKSFWYSNLFRNSAGLSTLAPATALLRKYVQPSLAPVHI